MQTETPNGHQNNLSTMLVNMVAPPVTPLSARNLDAVALFEIGLCGRFSAQDYEQAKTMFKFLNRNDLIVPIYDAEFNVSGFRKIAWTTGEPDKWNKFRAQVNLDVSPFAMWNGVVPHRDSGVTSCVVIVEGEADFLTMSQFAIQHGVEACVFGILGGAGLSREFCVHLHKKYPIYIFTDIDDAGDRYAAKIREMCPEHDNVRRWLGVSKDGIVAKVGCIDWCDLNDMARLHGFLDKKWGHLGKLALGILDRMSAPMPRPFPVGAPLPQAARAPLQRSPTDRTEEQRREFAEKRFGEVLRLLQADYWHGNRGAFLKALAPVVSMDKQGLIAGNAEAALIRAATDGAHSKESKKDRIWIIKSMYRRIT